MLFGPRPRRGLIKTSRHTRLQPPFPPLGLFLPLGTPDSDVRLVALACVDVDSPLPCHTHILGVTLCRVSPATDTTFFKAEMSTGRRCYASV